MTQGPGGPPPFGGPPQQPYGPPPGQSGGAQPDPPSASPAAAADSTAPVGPARMLALAAAGLGVLIYLLSFLEGGGGLSNPYLLGGGLLTAASVLPKVGRVLLPGAIIVVVGALGLLQGITGAPATSAVLIVGLILAVLQAGAAVVAYLMDAGLVSAPAARPTGGGNWGPRQPGYGRPPGYGPGPSGYGPGGPGQMPGGPPPLFGPQPGAQPGWGPPQHQPPQATEVVPRMSGSGGPGAESNEDTSTNSFAVTPPLGKDDGADMFSESKPDSEQNRPEPPEDSAPAATTVIPIVTPDESDGRTQRTERSTSRSSDSTSVFGDGGMFTESTPGRRAESSSGEGRHEKPADSQRQDRTGVPPSEQTWFMPPDERPPN